MSFATDLQKARSRLGLTQAEAAGVLGLGRTIYVEWEGGKIPSKLKQAGALALLARAKPKPRPST